MIDTLLNHGGIFNTSILDLAEFGSVALFFGYVFILFLSGVFKAIFDQLIKDGPITRAAKKDRAANRRKK